MKNSSVLASPTGRVKIAVYDDQVCSIGFTDEPLCSGGDPLLEKAEAQLQEYFAGKRKTFDLPLKLEGTEFQERVWQALCRIPYGSTCSYSELAAAAGRPKAIRAAAQACHVNPIGIVVPCHRVIGKDGSLTGYAGGIEKKKFLLELEHRNEEQVWQ